MKKFLLAVFMFLCITSMCSENNYNDENKVIIVVKKGNVSDKDLRSLEVIEATYWPDYVFSQDYELMSLEELENYITDNKHLPGIISAAEVAEHGDIDLGEINTKLLEKIEELTLYIIDLQKQINELKK